MGQHSTRLILFENRSASSTFDIVKHIVLATTFLSEQGTTAEYQIMGVAVSPIRCDIENFRKEEMASKCVGALEEQILHMLNSY